MTIGNYIRSGIIGITALSGCESGEIVGEMATLLDGGIVRRIAENNQIGSQPGGIKSYLFNRDDGNYTCIWTEDSELYVSVNGGAAGASFNRLREICKQYQEMTDNILER